MEIVMLLVAISFLLMVVMPFYFRYLEHIEKINEQEQITFIYCKCGEELCSNGSFISDTYDENDDNHVKYVCTKCGEESDFNFDIAPTPISWEYLNRNSLPPNTVQPKSRKC